MDHKKVHPVAVQLRERLRPACLKTAIGGGLRRVKPDVHDIELVLLPHWEEAQADLFGGAVVHSAKYCSEFCPKLDSVLGSLLEEGVLAWDEETVRRGSFYKRFVVPALGGLACEIFCARNLNNWGNILAIRTGDAEWSKACITSRSEGGLLRPGLKQVKGFVERSDGGVVPCVTEGMFFQLCGLSEAPEPRLRSRELALDLGAKEWLFERVAEPALVGSGA